MNDAFDNFHTALLDLHHTIMKEWSWRRAGVIYVVIVATAFILRYLGVL